MKTTAIFAIFAACFTAVLSVNATPKSATSFQDVSRDAELIVNRTSKGELISHIAAAHNGSLLTTVGVFNRNTDPQSVINDMIAMLYLESSTQLVRLA
jgi:phenylalanyl-tRNA synthetase beta subunit